MPRYLIELQASDGYTDKCEVDLLGQEAALTYAVELASHRLELEADAGRPLAVQSTIRNERREILGTIRSTAEPSC